MTSSTRDNSMFSDDQIVAMARTVESHDHDRIDPPAQVWNNILAELEVEVASQEASARRETARWFNSARLLSIAAATLLMVGVAAAIVFTGNDTASETEVASASMSDDGLPVATTELASAVVVCDDDERCFVEVELTGLPDAGNDELELWVINGDVTDMHSLGLITEATGRYELPANVSATDFPIIDISIEPDDGDETHSGQSVLRGVFDSI